ncbi:hypothetical protein KC19_VG333500 [Ceratodon purpureus]|uniref:Uncharacterized protein n=1 Tax=Ceratodon purpureus TaxID=3225 RepID=A0A8T0HW57_CERPU|nr:hypothetical protein KC19_VG333500 [Ceratodon purpureus]
MRSAASTSQPSHQSHAAPRSHHLISNKAAFHPKPAPHSPPSIPTPPSIHPPSPPLPLSPETPPAATHHRSAIQKPPRHSPSVIQTYPPLNSHPPNPGAAPPRQHGRILIRAAHPGPEHRHGACAGMRSADAISPNPIPETLASRNQQSTPRSSATHPRNRSLRPLPWRIEAPSSLSVNP